MTYKLAPHVTAEMLEEVGFKTFLGFDEKTIFAVRDSKDSRCNLFQYYRLGVDEINRYFRKSKFRGGGKCLLTLNVTKKDIQDLIEKGWAVEK